MISDRLKQACVLLQGKKNKVSVLLLFLMLRWQNFFLIIFLPNFTLLSARTQEAVYSPYFKNVKDIK